MKEYLIVDGYNIMHAWPEMAALMEDNLEHARDYLVDQLAQFGAIGGYTVIIVFDAHMVKGGTGSYELRHGVEIIYTQEGETADSVIERIVSSYIYQGKVIVATSDWSQQRIIFGKGASRMPARELISEVIRLRVEQNQKFGRGNCGSEQRIGSRLKEEVRVLLERMRRQK